MAEVAAQHDLDPSPLRTFLDALEAVGELDRASEPVSWSSVASLVAQTDRAVLMPVAGFEIPVLANVMASRRRWAIALGVEEQDISVELERRLRSPIAPVRVSDAPVQDIVQIGNEADLSALPVYLQHALDGAPYISSSRDVTRKPGSDGYNLGVRRMMLRGPRSAAIAIDPSSDLGAMARATRLSPQSGRLEMAVVIGLSPPDYLASQVATRADDEYDLAGALRCRPVPLTGHACPTWSGSQLKSTAPRGAGYSHARISLSDRSPGLGRDVLLAALSSYPGLKQVIVVDEDIDVFDSEDVEWAASVRVQADRDIVIVPGMRAAFSSDPSLDLPTQVSRPQGTDIPGRVAPVTERPALTGSKLGIDATCRYDKPIEVFQKSGPQAVTQHASSGSEDSRGEDYLSILESTLDAWPSFAEWVKQFPAVSLGQFLRALQELRDSGRLIQRLDGRYGRPQSLIPS